MVETLQLKDAITEKFLQAPVGKNYAIFSITFVNISGVASTINTWIVKNGDTANNDNLFLQQKSLTAGSVYTFKEKIFLGEQDKVAFMLDAGTDQVNVFINYIEV